MVAKHNSKAQWQIVSFYLLAFIYWLLANFHHEVAKAQRVAKPLPDRTETLPENKVSLPDKKR